MYSTFRVFFGDDPKVRCAMEVERTYDGICKLKEALDALDDLKERLGDAFPDKKYEQQKKRLVNAALKDDMRAAKVGGVKAEVVQVQRWQKQRWCPPPWMGMATQLTQRSARSP